MEETTERNMLFLDEDREKTVKIGNGTSASNFKIRALFPNDRIKIEKFLAIESNGLPINSYSQEGRYLMQRAVTVNHAVREGPDWWTNADECSEEDLLDRLYEAIMSWSSEFQGKLKKNRSTKRSTTA